MCLKIYLCFLLKLNKIKLFMNIRLNSLAIIFSCVFQAALVDKCNYYSVMLIDFFV